MIPKSFHNSLNGGLSLEDVKKYEEEMKRVYGEAEGTDKPKKEKRPEQMPKKPAVIKDSFQSTEDAVTNDADKKNGELQEKIAALEEKNKKLAEDKKKLINERDSIQRAFTGEKNHNEIADKNLSKLEGELKAVRDEYAKFKQRVNSERDPLIDARDAEITELKKQNKTLDEALRGLKISLAKSEKSVTDSNKKISELEKEITNLKMENEKITNVLESEKYKATLAKSKTDNPSVAKNFVERISPTEFRSVLFTLPTYKVILARDFSTISFKPDVIGKAMANDSVIRLPSVERYVPFSEVSKYNVDVMSDGTIMVKLTQAIGSE